MLGLSSSFCFSHYRGLALTTFSSLDARASFAGSAHFPHSCSACLPAVGHWLVNRSSVLGSAVHLGPEGCSWSSSIDTTPQCLRIRPQAPSPAGDESSFYLTSLSRPTSPRHERQQDLSPTAHCLWSSRPTQPSCHPETKNPSLQGAALSVKSPRNQGTQNLRMKTQVSWSPNDTSCSQTWPVQFGVPSWLCASTQHTLSPSSSVYPRNNRHAPNVL